MKIIQTNISINILTATLLFIVKMIDKIAFFLYFCGQFIIYYGKYLKVLCMQSLLNKVIKAIVIFVIVGTTNKPVFADYKPELNEWNQAEIACAAVRLPLVVAAKYYEPEHSKRSLIMLSLAEISRFTNGLLHYRNNLGDDIRIVLFFAALELAGMGIRISDELSYQKNRKEQMELMQQKALAMGYKIPISGQDKKNTTNKALLLLPCIEGCAAIYKAWDNTQYDNPYVNNRRFASIIEILVQ